MDALSDFDRQRLEDLNKLIRDDLRDLIDIERRQAVETRTLEKRRFNQDAEQVRESYNRHREEYAGLFIDTVVQQLPPEQQTVTHNVLQMADRNPNEHEFVQLLAEVAAALPTVQRQLAEKNTPAAQQVAQVAHILQAPTADLKQKLKLSIPLIPLFLTYETEFNLNVTANIKGAWERLKERWLKDQCRPS